MMMVCNTLYQLVYSTVIEMSGSVVLLVLAGLSCLLLANYI